MASVKTRLAFAGGKYLVTHPRSRVTRLVVRVAVRRLSKKLALAAHADAIPATRGSRLATVVGVAAVAGGIGIVVVVRRTRRPAAAESVVVVPPAHAPFPPARAAEPAPTGPVAGGAAGVGDGDEALAARVEARLFGEAPALGVSVEAAGGVVTLRGKVADEEAEGRFVRDAEQVEGVKAVQSELQTAGTEPAPPAS